MLLETDLPIPPVELVHALSPEERTILERHCWTLTVAQSPENKRAEALLDIYDRDLLRGGDLIEFAAQFGIKPARVYQLVVHARKIRIMFDSTMVESNIMPNAERQTRYLDVDDPVTDWLEAVELNHGRRATARLVKQVVDAAIERIHRPPLTTTRTEHTRLVMGSSESPEWYTPINVLDLVYQVFDVELDPCSNSHVTPNVKTATRYTKADDGLSKVWEGTVYLIPRMVKRLAAGRTS